MIRSEAIDYLKSISNTDAEDYFYGLLDDTTIYTSYQAIQEIIEQLGCELIDKNSDKFKESTLSFALIGISAEQELFTPVEQDSLQFVLVPDNKLIELVEDTQNHFKNSVDHRIKIEKPILPKWLGEDIKFAKSKYEKDRNVKDDLMEQFNYLQEYIRKAHSINPLSSESMYVIKHQKEIFSALMYGYEMEK